MDIFLQLLYCCMCFFERYLTYGKPLRDLACSRLGDRAIDGVILNEIAILMIKSVDFLWNCFYIIK